MSCTFVIKRPQKCQNDVSFILFKMADVKAGKTAFIKAPTLGPMLGITRQSLVMPSSDPRDKIVYPIHKLMLDSYKPSALSSRIPQDHFGP